MGRDQEAGKNAKAGKDTKAEVIKEAEMNENRIQIGDTPLSISVYSVEEYPARKNEPGILEIIFCLRGSVLFSYAYEEFTLHEGEYIAVDTDAYFFRKGTDNLCVSFFINLLEYKEKYPLIEHELFVCEGTSETDVKCYPTIYHERIKGLMLLSLVNLCDENETIIREITDDIVDTFVKHFDICIYHFGSENIAENKLERMKKINLYMVTHYLEKITLKDVADSQNITEGYLSEFMRKYSVGFRDMLAYIRANASESLLINTEKNIAEISEECGFSDTKYYYSAFKRWYRCTPRQFRERYTQVIEKVIDYYPVDSTKESVDKLMNEHYKSVFLSDIFNVR